MQWRARPAASVKAVHTVQIVGSTGWHPLPCITGFACSTSTTINLQVQEPINNSAGWGSRPHIQPQLPQKMPLGLMRRRHRRAQLPHTTDTGVRSGARHFSGSGRQVSWFTLSCPHNGARAARAQGHLHGVGSAGCNNNASPFLNVTKLHSRLACAAGACCWQQDLVGPLQLLPLASRRHHQQPVTVAALCCQLLLQRL